MDAAGPATWIITIACTTVAAVSAALFVALGAYKIGKVEGKLKQAESRGDPAPALPGAVAANDEDASKKKKKKKGSDDDDDDDDDDSESDSEAGSEEEAEGDRETGDGEKAKKRKALKKVRDDAWEWPVYDQWWSNVTYRLERKLRKSEAAKGKAKATAAPFEVTYEQEKGWPDAVTVTLKSAALIRIARKCLPSEAEELVVEKPRIDARQLFHGLERLREELRAVQDDASLARHHLRHLVRFLEKEYKDTIVQVERMGRARAASWELLWAFLPKGARVYYTCAMTGQTLQGVVRFVYYDESMQGKFFQCFLDCCDYNGQRFVKCSVAIKVDKFKSEKALDAVGICPMRLLADGAARDMEAALLRNGRKFYHIVSQGSCYMDYEGARLRMVMVDRCWLLKKQKASGRVMVDLMSFARMNPGYPLGNAQPASCCGAPSFAGADPDVPSDEDLMLAPAVVYGFSFANKQWGGFDVNGFSEIRYDDDAFDRDLVLADPKRKEMLLSLVAQYLRPADDEAVAKLDPISNKGDGCIFLCYGPPGTGKTLTAESLAEKLHRPLWSISVFELGTTAKELETNLIEILDIASQWRAVLLLDEADIYMEKRTSNGDPGRTAMTAIFLRLLEYYRGVLFLTTNRVASFDDAFCSRISMFLRYHRLAGEQRHAVWSNLLRRAGVADPVLAPFLETRLNGREIRNTIRIAQTWARSANVALTTDHVLEVVNMLGEFRHDLEGAIQDETDERSISRALTNVRSLRPCGSADALNGTFVQVDASAN